MLLILNSSWEFLDAGEGGYTFTRAEPLPNMHEQSYKSVMYASGEALLLYPPSNHATMT